jgi:TldD protein
MRGCALFLPLAAALAFSQPPPADDVILQALRSELERSRLLEIPGIGKPYYVEFSVEDIKSGGVLSSLGALVSVVEDHNRNGRVQLRAGNYAFDNTNYVFTDAFTGQFAGRVPLDNDYLTLRRAFWLAADRHFKGAAESFARKRAALRNVTVREQIDDFAPAEPVKLYLPVEHPRVDLQAWAARVQSLSALFADYPEIHSSDVEFRAAQAGNWYLNSEGTEARYPESLYIVRVRASSQAADGMPVRDWLVFQARSIERLEPEAAMRREIQTMAKNVVALTKAPLAEDYAGPVLVEGIASPQLFAQLLGGNLFVPRRPVNEPGRTPPFVGSELEGRVGSRILPEWIDVVDDPTRTAWRGRELFGHYRIDMEGVLPRPVTVVEKGVLKSYLMTRQPVRGFSQSTGHARLPGFFGAKAAAIGNLFVRAERTASEAELRKRLIELCELRGLPYGIVLRKLDFPTTAGFDEIRRLSMAGSQRGGSARPVSLPILAYRLYPDGREELVRGLRLRGVNVRSFRDVIAASEEQYVFDFLNNTAPLATMAGASVITNSSVIAPSVLFEDLELERLDEDWPKLPLVPPPPLVSRR